MGCGVSVIPFDFLKVLPDDIRQHGADGACVLALIRYATSFDGERNGRRLIDGEMWWVVTYAEIAEVIGVSPATVKRIVLRLEASGDLLSDQPDMVKGDKTKAFRVPLTSKRSNCTVSDQQEVKMTPPRGQNDQTPEVKMTPPRGQNDLFYSSYRELEELREEEGGERALALAGDAAPRDPFACPVHGYADPGTPCPGCMNGRKEREKQEPRGVDAKVLYWQSLKRPEPDDTPIPALQIAGDERTALGGSHGTGEGYGRP